MISEKKNTHNPFYIHNIYNIMLYRIRKIYATGMRAPTMVVRVTRDKDIS